jgi:hypothetical protein
MHLYDLGMTAVAVYWAVRWRQVDGDAQIA